MDENLLLVEQEVLATLQLSESIRRVDCRPGFDDEVIQRYLSGPEPQRLTLRLAAVATLVLGLNVFTLVRSPAATTHSPHALEEPASALACEYGLLPHPCHHP